MDALRRLRIAKLTLTTRGITNSLLTSSACSIAYYSRRGKVIVLKMMTIGQHNNTEADLKSYTAHIQLLLDLDLLILYSTKENIKTHDFFKFSRNF